MSPQPITGSPAADAAPETAAAAAEAAEIASPENEMIDAITANQQEALMTAEAAGRAAYEGYGAVQREIAGFVAERIRQDIETQQALLGCRSFDDFREVQSRFLRTAIDQYSTEASRLTKLGRDMVARTIAHQAD